MRTALSLILAAAAPALAQPTLFEVRMGPTDISPDGNTVLGGFYNAETNSADVMKFTLVGGAIVRIPITPVSGVLTMSDDTNTVLYEGGNLENINNALNSITYSAPDQWESVAVATTWSESTGRVNRGVFPNGNRCDYTINTAADLSANGRYIVGGMWTGGLCGPFRAYINDTVTGTITQLPFSFEGAPANTFADADRANAVNATGTVVVGYDHNNRPTGGRVRRPAVWKRNGSTWALTVIDREGGEAYCVNADGTYVGGTDSTGAMCRWHFNGTTWDREVCTGGQGLIPTSITPDGSTMVGDIFIWSPNINDGVAVGLADYAASLGSFFPNFTFGSPLGATVWGVSDDGRKVLVRGIDFNSICLETFTAAVLNFDGAPCVAPKFLGDPASDTSVAPAPGYYSYGIILNAFPAGTWPLTYQWQKRDADGQWTDMVDDVYCNTNYGGADFDTKAVTSSQLRLGFLSGTWRGRYRCVVTNPCGSVVSGVSRITDCPADYNTDAGVDSDDVIAYFADWDAGSDEADFDNANGVDSDDIIAFFTAWDQGC